MFSRCFEFHATSAMFDENESRTLWPLVLATRAGVVQALITLSDLVPVVEDEIIALKNIKGHVNL